MDESSGLEVVFTTIGFTSGGMRPSGHVNSNLKILLLLRKVVLE